MATIQIYGTLPESGGGGGGGGSNVKITFGTEDLIPGVSPLEEGTLYFVYE